MDLKPTVRQILFLYIFISISAIFNMVPNIAAYNAGRSGYMSTIYSGIILCAYAYLLLQILRIYPNMNFYEILSRCLGRPIAKLIMVLYFFWAYFNVFLKTGQFSVTMQATLMPSIHPGILLVIFFLLIIYTLSKNLRTIFRFSEFVYQPIIFFLLILLLFALPSIDYFELVPITEAELLDNLYSVDDILTIAGNLVLFLFFSGTVTASGAHGYVRNRVFHTVLMFTLLTLLCTITSIGINGASTTAGLAFPIFQSVRNISVLNTFERFDSFITLIEMLSDFIYIVIFLVVMMKCLFFIFNYENSKIMVTVLFFISCSYILIRNFTQLELTRIYESYGLVINLGFQYIIPVILGVVCLFRKPFSGVVVNESK